MVQKLFGKQKSFIMKQLTLFLFLALSAMNFQAQQSQINWMSIEEAVQAQKKNPKKIMIDVYTKWCGPCKMMMKNTFTNTDVINYINANYYAVKLDAEQPGDINYNGKVYGNPDYVANKAGRNGVHQLSRYFQVRAYPTLVYLDEDLNIIAPISGYKTPQQLELYLKFFKSNDYKTVSTNEEWTQYQSGFTPTFK